MEREKIDYPEFEKRVLTDANGVEVKIIGFNHFVGVTFVYANDQKKNYCCLVGAGVPKMFDRTLHAQVDGLYDEVFDRCVKMVEEDCLDTDFLVSTIGTAYEKSCGLKGCGRMSGCSYSA